MAKTYSAGVTTAYGAAKRGGYTGTYEEFCSDLAQLANVLSEFLGFSVTVQTLAEGASATASYDDGVLALGIPRGNTGNGIQSIVLNADYTLTVTYTNGNTWTSGSIRGQVGATPHLTIGTVQTLEPGQSATADITGTDENPVLNLGIPKGQAGASDAGGVSYDPEGSYDEGTVGAELQEQNRQLDDKQNAPATAGNAGQVLSLDSNLDPVWVDQTGGKTVLTILSYGHSTWADFLAAYNANRVVYCRASSSDNPGSGSQNRLAFLAFVQGTADRPTGAEFQYYRSVSSHTAEQQGDQVFVYTLSNKGIWDVTTREASTKIAAGTNLSQAYSNGTLTLSFDGTGYITAPATAGTAGQVLGLGSNLNPTWMDQTGGGGGMNIVNLSGTQITQVGAENTFYVCGELTELTFTAPPVGITMIRFTSGTTPTVLTVNGVTSWMFDNDPTAASLEANKTYDINVLNGVGVVGWA